MTVAEASAALGVSTATVYGYIRSRTLRSRKREGHYILLDRDVADLHVRRAAAQYARLRRARR